jgi:hypothetical protein
VKKSFDSTFLIWYNSAIKALKQHAHRVNGGMGFSTDNSFYVNYSVGFAFRSPSERKSGVCFAFRGGGYFLSKILGKNFLVESPPLVKEEIMEEIMIDKRFIKIAPLDFEMNGEFGHCWFCDKSIRFGEVYVDFDPENLVHHECLLNFQVVIERPMPIVFWWEYS